MPTGFVTSRGDRRRLGRTLRVFLAAAILASPAVDALERFLPPPEPAPFETWVLNLPSPRDQGALFEGFRAVCSASGPDAWAWFNADRALARSPLAEPDDGSVGGWVNCFPDGSRSQSFRFWLLYGDPRTRWSGHHGAQDDCIVEIPPGVADYSEGFTVLSRPRAIEFDRMEDEVAPAACAAFSRRFGEALETRRFSHSPSFVDQSRDIPPMRREMAVRQVYADLLAWAGPLTRPRWLGALSFPRFRISPASIDFPPGDLAVLREGVPASVSRGAMIDLELQNQSLPVFPASSARGPLAAVSWPDPPPPWCATVARDTRAPTSGPFANVRFVREPEGPSPEPPSVGPPEPMYVDIRLSRVGFSADLSQAVVAVESKGLGLCSPRVLVLRRSLGAYRVVAAEPGFCAVF